MLSCRGWGGARVARFLKALVLALLAPALQGSTWPTPPPYTSYPSPQKFPTPFPTPMGMPGVQRFLPPFSPPLQSKEGQDFWTQAKPTPPLLTPGISSRPLPMPTEPGGKETPVAAQAGQAQASSSPQPEGGKASKVPLTLPQAAIRLAGWTQQVSDSQAQIEAMLAAHKGDWSKLSANEQARCKKLLSRWHKAELAIQTLLAGQESEDGSGTGQP